MAPCHGAQGRLRHSGGHCELTILPGRRPSSRPQPVRSSVECQFIVQRSSNYFPPWRDPVKWLKWKLLKEELFLQNICRRLTFSMPVLGTLLTLRVNASPGRYSSKTLFASVSLLKSVTQRPSKKEHHFINNGEKIVYKCII